MVQRIPMSLTGHQQLRDELERLERVERHEIVKAIEVARAHGDLSENAEYHAAKERQSLVEGRILELKDKLGASQLELNTAEFAGSGAPVRGSRAAEATAALVGLGYSQTEAAAALKGIDLENLSIEDVIRRALRAAAQQ